MEGWMFMKSSLAKRQWVHLRVGSISFVISLTLMCPLPAIAQETRLVSTQDADLYQPSLTVTSRLVVLDVVVTNTKGEVVQGLTQKDFTIYQDGKPQVTQNFHARTEQTNISPTTPTLDRFGHESWGDDVPLVIFVLDELNTPFDEKSFAIENLHNYLHSQPSQLAVPSMLLTVNYTSLNTLCNYTRDRDKLLPSLEHHPPTIPSQELPWNLPPQHLPCCVKIAHIYQLADHFAKPASH
jgi:hypothetical protein